MGKKRKSLSVAKTVAMAVELDFGLMYRWMHVWHQKYLYVWPTDRSFFFQMEFIALRVQ